MAADETSEAAMTLSGQHGARCRGGARRRESDLRLSSRSTDSASVASPEPHFVAMTRLASGGDSRLGERRVEVETRVTMVRGPPSRTDERSRKSSRIVAALERGRRQFVVPSSCAWFRRSARHARAMRGAFREKQIGREQAWRMARPGGAASTDQTKAGGALERRLSGLSSRSRPRREAKWKRVEISKR